MRVGLGALFEDDGSTGDSPGGRLSGGIEEIRIKRHPPALSRSRFRWHGGLVDLMSSGGGSGKPQIVADKQLLTALSIRYRLSMQDV